jgi:IS4 transposase
MRISHAKTSDVSTLDHIVYLPGAFYVLDRGYVDFARLRRIHLAHAWFVIRPKRRMKYRVSGRMSPGDPNTGVTHDRLIRLNGQNSRKLGKWPMRLIRYIDPTTGKRLTFLTNHLTLAAGQVALLYRKRWKIELLFKWMKQHLHIKSFFGTSPNAVKSQLWIAVLVLVLIHRLKHRLNLPQTPNDIAQILSVTLCEKALINQAFFNDRDASPPTLNRNQLQLFEL